MHELYTAADVVEIDGDTDVYINRMGEVDAVDVTDELVGALNGLNGLNELAAFVAVERSCVGENNTDDAELAAAADVGTPTVDAISTGVKLSVFGLLVAMDGTSPKATALIT